MALKRAREGTKLLNPSGIPPITEGYLRSFCGRCWVTDKLCSHPDITCRDCARNPQLELANQLGLVGLPG